MDERDLNIVIVLSEKHRGTSYMETLYASGITGAIFQGNRDSTATAGLVANLLHYKRKRADARKYYGIMEKTGLHLDSLSAVHFTDLMAGLNDISYGSSRQSRFLSFPSKTCS